jgi:uncharacterized protein
MKNAVLACCCFLTAASSAWAQAARGYDDRPKISVSGDATVYVTPDRVIVQLGVETQDKNMVAAKQKSNDILKKVFAAIKACGVKERDIQTEYLYAEPRWTQVAPAQQSPVYQAPVQSSSNQDTEETRRFLGYYVKNTIAVTLKDVTKIDKLIADVLEAGATHIYGVQFQTSELKKHREEARVLALKAAKEKAVKMAAVLDQSIGPPIDISEGGETPRYNVSQNVLVPTSSTPSPVEASTIALGKIAICAGVTVTFELKR